MKLPKRLVEAAKAKGCTVEIPHDAGLHKTSPRYEIVAPDGFELEAGGLHSLLCWTVKDGLESLEGVHVRPCTGGDACDCRAWVES